MSDFGPDAGMEYGVHRYVSRALAHAKDVFMVVLDSRPLTTEEVAGHVNLPVDVVSEILCRLQVLGLVSGDTVGSAHLTWTANVDESLTREDEEQLFERAWAVW